MGERAQRAYDAEQDKAFATLPWRERMRARFPGLLLFLAALMLAAAFVVPFFVGT